MNMQIETNIENKIDTFLNNGYKKTEAFHTAILFYSKDIEKYYHSVEEKSMLAERLKYTKSMGQEIQKLINVGRIIRTESLTIQ